MPGSARLSMSPLTAKAATALMELNFQPGHLSITDLFITGTVAPFPNGKVVGWELNDPQAAPLATTALLLLADLLEGAHRYAWSQV